LAIHERLFHDYGQSRPIAIAYAEALLHENDPDRAALASTLLRDQLRRAPDDLKLTELLAMAADRAGDPVRAAEAVATNYYYRGGLPQAIDQLERVLQRDDLSYYDRARIAARLDQLRVERMRSNRRPDDGQ
jgi:predicted Zn-dependent protease